MIIYYNADCSKCREAVDLLNGQNCEFQIREYLKEPPSKEELGELVSKLGCRPIDLVRKTEPQYINEYASAEKSDSEWIDILSNNPQLIERPIVIDGERAIIGRPPVLVVEFAGKSKK